MNPIGMLNGVNMFTSLWFDAKWNAKFFNSCTFYYTYKLNTHVWSSCGYRSSFSQSFLFSHSIRIYKT